MGCKKSKTMCHCKKCYKKKYYKKVYVPYYKTKCHKYHKSDHGCGCGYDYDYMMESPDMYYHYHDHSDYDRDDYRSYGHHYKYDMY